MPENMLETTDEFLQDCERIISLYHDPKPYSMMVMERIYGIPVSDVVALENQGTNM